MYNKSIVNTLYTEESYSRVVNLSNTSSRRKSYKTRKQNSYNIRLVVYCCIHIFRFTTSTDCAVGVT